MAEAIFQAFSALPEPQQARIDAECQDIESMAHQAGVTALIDEATDFHKNAEDIRLSTELNRCSSLSSPMAWEGA